MSQPGRPDWAALWSMADDLRQAWASFGETQRRLAELTGTARSPDGMVTAVVGAKGQLVELEIDPRVFRNPDARALAASIVETAHRASLEVTDKVRQIVASTMPADMRSGGFLPPDLEKVVFSHDIDARRNREQG